MEEIRIWSQYQLYSTVVIYFLYASILSFKTPNNFNASFPSNLCNVSTYAMRRFVDERVFSIKKRV